MISNKKERLEQLEATIKACRKCRLCETATNAVPGEGNFNAELVFVGEAPGAQEDLTGRPFVGRAGKLLDKMLEQIGMHRSDVWIGNIVKHRPPENRDPLPDEVTACSPYLAMQLEIIKPKLVVTLGRYALYHFYADGKITRDHGNIINVGNYNVYPVYHPAAALRNPAFAKALVEDFKQIPNLLAGVKNSNQTPDVLSSEAEHQLGLTF
jgi:DNA polymerase